MTNQSTDRSGSLLRFQLELGPLWPEVKPLCIDLGAEDFTTLIASAHRCAHGRDTRIRLLAGDLEALLAGWTHYDADERAVLRAAVTYLEGAATDRLPTGAAPGRTPRTETRPASRTRRDDAAAEAPDVERVDGVVEAAVRTVLRG